MTQRCSGCKQTKQLDEFYNAGAGKKSAYCKPCTNEYQKTRRREKGLLRTPEQKRDHNLWRYHHITLEDYRQMFNAQNGRCKLCGIKAEDELNDLQVDHNHDCCPNKAWSCGKCIRGLLCGSCNRRMVTVDANPDFYSRALKYRSAL